MIMVMIYIETKMMINTLTPSPLGAPEGMGVSQGLGRSGGKGWNSVGFARKAEEA